MAVCEVRQADLCRMGCQDGKLLILGQAVLSGAARKRKISSVSDLGSGIQMDKDNLPLLEDQNPVRRSKIFAGSRSETLALTEVIKSLSNVSGREADIEAEMSSLRDETDDS
ncbi:Uncharacterised protein [Yersinia pseudotuberculosis]|nr:Uncharacterised protein [Yersinia pseudotuberculosis]CNI88194.1 Uncharacterised protein [Yersinia pseudotuberculosis]CNJ24471.1 Uncharacterised protein [Yersinia pseudotuberculosis]VEE73688.1 Uncharacterised protein [Yersinia pseudotuberculosis]